MADKTLFPQYWINLREDVILENIKYLDANLSQYDIMPQDDYWLKLHKEGDYDIDIAFYDIVQHQQRIHVAKINGKIMRNDKNPELYNETKLLYDKCTKQKDSLKVKVKNTWKDNKKKICSYFVAGACLVVVEFGIILYINHKQNKERQEKIEFAKDLLKSYEAERAKGTVNMDSLINQHVR